MKKIDELSQIPPLSKFGIEHQFKVYKNEVSFKRSLPEGRLYVYSAKNTHSFATILKTNNNDEKHPIISKIRLKIDEKSHEN